MRFVKFELAGRDVYVNPACVFSVQPYRSYDSDDKVERAVITGEGGSQVVVDGSPSDVSASLEYDPHAP